MNLNGRQLMLLLLPFIAGAVFFIFADDLVKNIKYLFPEYVEYSNPNLHEKAKIYLKMDKRGEKYREILHKIDVRKKNRSWIVENILYSKEKVAKIVLEKKKYTQSVKKYQWTLQMAYPSKDIAIINGRIIKINEVVNTARLIKIEKDKVLLYKKGKLTWVHLFN